MANGVYTNKCNICGEEFDSLLKPSPICSPCRLQEPEEDYLEEDYVLLEDPQIQAIYGDFIRYNSL